MAISPIFIGTVKSPSVQVATANTLRDGTGTLGTVYTAGASGARIDRINVTATGTTTAGMIRLFLYDGTNSRLISELPVIAITPAATTPSFSADIVFDQGMLMQATYQLRASTNNAETFNVTVTNGGDY